MISWIDLNEKSPIDISRLKDYARDFERLVNVKISRNNITRAKRSIVEARGFFDLMIITLQQTLYDRSILKTGVDEMLYSWLIYDFGNFFRYLDSKEQTLIIANDSMDVERSLVGVSRISAYARILKTSSRALVYESLMKAIEEYNLIDEEKQREKGIEEKKILKKDKRTFLYILFQIFQTTLSSISISKETGNTSGSRNISMRTPKNYQTLLSARGQKEIIQEANKETKQGIEIPDNLKNAEDDTINYYEEYDV